MLLPFSATLQKQYRDTLETSSAPTEIDTATPVLPVAVVAQVNTATSASYVRISDGTDTATVDASGSINVLLTPVGTSQTHVNVSGNGTGASQNAYTVTAGKTFYLMGVNAYSSAANQATTVYANDGTTVRLKIGSGTAGTSDSRAVVSQPVPIAVYAAAEVVKITAGASSSWNIWGVEQ